MTVERRLLRIDVRSADCRAALRQAVGDGWVVDAQPESAACILVRQLGLSDATSEAADLEVALVYIEDPIVVAPLVRRR